MSSNVFLTPVALIIFNRPDKVKQSLENLRLIKPQKLFVIADGPRTGNVDDFSRCSIAQEYIETVDWNCEVHKNYSKKNLGCARRVSSGLDWVFEKTEKAIILEDDCIPDPSFFQFSEELLERYQDNERIFSISGSGLSLGLETSHYDYYFSQYSSSWGWATWRRAWKHFDFDMVCWEVAKKEKFLQKFFGNEKHANSWEKTFDYVLKGEKIDSWAFRWTFTCWLHNALHVKPYKNLVSNVGFGPDATHTTGLKKYEKQSTESLLFPLDHPPFIVREFQIDELIQKRYYNYHKSFFEKILYKLNFYLESIK